MRPRPLAGAVALCALWLGGCALTTPPTTTPGGVPIDTRYSSRAQDSRVQFLVLHYTAGGLESSLRTLTEGDVSAHYLVTDETPPRILRLVPEERRAWHSGASGWQRNRMLNSSSIGIEIVHPGYVLAPPAPDGTRERIDMPFAPAQIEALIPLVKDIATRHGIRPEHILGHGEVSPSYKEDPGPTFPWRRLADLGLTPPWPDAARVLDRLTFYEGALPDAAWFQRKLAEHGYPIEADAPLDDPVQLRLLQRVLTNFQMRYRPARFDGRPDAESAALLDVLSAGDSP
ncbi:MAG TPA: N-acetylmuramoyl-L-alanine amidase [Rubrivivax sp.]|nr:N-acetylmuramoyl-L-alanine amidase [Rubrivivax sp.]